MTSAGNATTCGVTCNDVKTVLNVDRTACGEFFLHVSCCDLLLAQILNYCKTTISTNMNLNFCFMLRM